MIGRKVNLLYIRDASGDKAVMLRFPDESSWCRAWSAELQLFCTCSNRSASLTGLDVTHACSWQDESNTCSQFLSLTFQTTIASLYSPETLPLWHTEQGRYCMGWWKWPIRNMDEHTSSSWLCCRHKSKGWGWFGWIFGVDTEIWCVSIIYIKSNVPVSSEQI